MIAGTCPYKGCDGRVWTSTPDNMPLPQYERHKCEECKRVMWTKHSRIDPCSWTERNFLKEFNVDKKAKKIEPMNKPKKLTAKEILIKELYEQVWNRFMRDYLLFGVGFDPSKGVPPRR